MYVEQGKIQNIAPDGRNYEYSFERLVTGMHVAMAHCEIHILVSCSCWKFSSPLMFRSTRSDGSRQFTLLWLMTSHSMESMKTALHGSPTPSFNREETHGHKRSQHESTRRIDGGIWIAIAGIDGDKRRTETSNTVQTAADTSTSSTIGSWEDLGSVGV